MRSCTHQYWAWILTPTFAKMATTRLPICRLRGAEHQDALSVSLWRRRCLVILSMASEGPKVVSRIAGATTTVWPSKCHSVHGSHDLPLCVDQIRNSPSLAVGYQYCHIITANATKQQDGRSGDGFFHRVTSASLKAPLRQEKLLKNISSRNDTQNSSLLARQLFLRFSAHLLRAVYSTNKYGFYETLLDVLRAILGLNNKKSNSPLSGW